MQATENRDTCNSARHDVDALTRALSAHFDPNDVKFKPAVVSGSRALALAYVDARAIQDRLDEVLGVSGWQDEYECLPDGSVICRLHLRLGDDWITKMDVGGQSEQPDEGDRKKAAFSDALKRAAVKFGIGRYLYRLPAQWCDYDVQKKQFTRLPAVPIVSVAKKPRVTTLPAKPVATAQTRTAPKPATPPNPPANGAELRRRLYDHDARLAKRGVCQPGELVKHVVAAGVKAGYDPDPATWMGPAIVLAIEETRSFESTRRRVAEKVA